MIAWNLAAIERHMARRKIANANQLADRTGLTIPTAYHVLSGGRVYRIETATLERLADYFGVSPWSLLTRTKG